IFHQMLDRTVEAGLTDSFAQTLDLLRTGSLDKLNDTGRVADLLRKICFHLQEFDEQRRIHAMMKWQVEQERWHGLQGELAHFIKIHEKIERFLAWDDKAKAMIQAGAKIKEFSSRINRLVGKSKDVKVAVDSLRKEVEAALAEVAKHEEPF